MSPAGAHGSGQATAISPEIILQLRDVNVTFHQNRKDIHALVGIDLDLRSGETLGLVGESGCGKSTTGRCVLRLIEPTAGEVWFEGRDVTKLDKRSMRALCRDMQMNVLTDKEGKPAAAIVSTGDNYDASKLILPDLYHKLAAVLGPDLAVGVPNRDFMIALGDANQDILRAVAAQVQADAAQREHGLTDQLFTLSSGAIRTYEWD